MKTTLPPFIAIEGMDGSGKTTLIGALEEAFLLSFDGRYCFTREPGGTPFAEASRELFLRFETEDPETKMLHLFTMRSSNLKRTIIPQRERGSVVICDRFDGSTLAYQAYAESETPEETARLERLFWILRKSIVNEENAPTLYIYLGLPPEIALARRSADAAQEKNHYDVKPIGFYRQQRVGYREFFREIERVGGSEIAFIDATESSDKVFEEALRIIRDHVRRIMNP